MSNQHDRSGSEQNKSDKDMEDIVEKCAAENAKPDDGEFDNDTDAALAELKNLANENWEKYLRISAELENVRKRASRDIENAHKFALERFCSELLTVKDSLEMGLAVAEKADAEGLLAGKIATLKLLTTIMERFGVAELNPEGEPFDPQEHEAMSMQPSSDVEPGSVLTVLQKGYALNDRLLRPARVLVASEPTENGEDNDDGE
ncbi:nucleotide exchange factor GrpE [Woeseiaceae bacterium]|nr:nucleotide exchange factor GrpE [Woeseiaceae bacterium]